MKMGFLLNINKYRGNLMVKISMNTKIAIKCNKNKNCLKIS